MENDTIFLGGIAEALIKVFLTPGSNESGNQIRNWGVIQAQSLLAELSHLEVFSKHRLGCQDFHT